MRISDERLAETEEIAEDCCCGPCRHTIKEIIADLREARRLLRQGRAVSSVTDAANFNEDVTAYFDANARVVRPETKREGA